MTKVVGEVNKEVLMLVTTDDEYNVEEAVFQLTMMYYEMYPEMEEL